jgi:hypothetical protein
MSKNITEQVADILLREIEGGFCNQPKYDKLEKATRAIVKFFETPPAPHPEPSEQSRGAFLEWLDFKIAKYQRLIDYKAATPWLHDTLKWLMDLREKYLSLHAQPKGEVGEGKDEFIEKHLAKIKALRAHYADVNSLTQEEAKTWNDPQPSPAEQEGEIPAEISNWIRAEYDNPENAIYNFDEFKYGAIAMYHKMHQDRAAALDVWKDWAENGAAQIKTLQSQISTKDKEIESLILSVENWEGEARRLKGENGEYRKALQLIRLHARFATPDGIEYTLAGKIAAEALDKYPTTKPSNNEPGS